MSDYEDEEYEDYDNNGDNDDNEDNDYDNKEIFVSEVKAFERASKGAAFYDFPQNEKINIRQQRKGLSEEELFLMSLELAYGRYRVLLSFSNTTTENIKSLIYRIKHLKFKNPGALLWGYYVLDGKGSNMKISSEKIIDAYKKLNPKGKRPGEKENSIKKEDMIRYARLIQNAYKEMEK